MPAEPPYRQRRPVQRRLRLWACVQASTGAGEREPGWRTRDHLFVSSHGSVQAATVYFDPTALPSIPLVRRARACVPAFLRSSCAAIGHQRPRARRGAFCATDCPDLRRTGAVQNGSGHIACFPTLAATSPRPPAGNRGAVKHGACSETASSYHTSVIPAEPARSLRYFVSWMPNRSAAVVGKRQVPNGKAPRGCG